jgi:hypothetical protein
MLPSLVMPFHPRRILSRTTASAAASFAFGLGLIAFAAAGSQAAVSPAQSDATGALSAATTALKADTVVGLLQGKTLRFAFTSATGTCPPGTSDGSYCVGASGTLSFELTLRMRGHRPVQATSTSVHFVGDSAVVVTATIDAAGIRTLRAAIRRGTTLPATMAAEAIISSRSFYTATGRTTLH